MTPEKVAPPEAKRDAFDVPKLDVHALVLEESDPHPQQENLAPEEALALVDAEQGPTLEQLRADHKKVGVRLKKLKTRISNRNKQKERTLKCSAEHRRAADNFERTILKLVRMNRNLERTVDMLSLEQDRLMIVIFEKEEAAAPP